MPKPFESGPQAAPVLKGAEKGELAKKFPELLSWLCDATYEGGAAMGMTCLQLRRHAAMMRAALKIQDQGGLVLEVVDKSVERALASLEAMLAAPVVPWQIDRFPLGGVVEKKKKT